MPTVTDFLELLLAQDGDKYVFGAEASLSDSDPDAFDCSELVEWACGRLGVQPRMPDGSWYQARHCKKYGTLIDVSEGIVTPGALLFKFSSSPFASIRRPSSAHVAISLGDGRTIEARSSTHGVGSFSAHNRGWTHAATVPGLSMGGVSTAPPAPGLPMLRVGASGLLVRLAQGLMLIAGVTINVDGQFGPTTDLKVRDWQKAKGLEVDGIVGPNTWASLKGAVGL